MQVIFTKVLTNVLTALYQPFWFSLLMAICVMFAVKQFHSFPEAMKQWISWFKTDKRFRRQFLLAFYTIMILFRTLLNRNMWANPLSNVWGVWGIYKINNGERVLTTESLENLALFIPFIILLLWCDEKDWLKTGRTFWGTVRRSAKLCFLFSFAIEMAQLFLRLGTWQLTDLFYNTLGGVIGAVIFWLCTEYPRIRRNFKK